MVSRDERDDLNFLRIEAPQISILDQVIRMTVMAIVADVYADVVKQCRVLEPFPFAIAQPVDAARLIEDAERQPCDLLRMLRPIPAPFPELDNASTAHVRVTLDFADTRAVAVDVIEDETFTEREIAKRQVFSSQASKNGVEEDGTADVQVRPPRIQARHVEPLLDVGFDEPLPQAMYGLGADALIPDVLRRGASLFRDRKRAETENGSRCSDHAIEAGLCDLLEIRPHLFIEMFDEPAFIMRREWIGFDEPFCETNDAGLEAFAERQVRGRAERDFDAAAANIDHHGGTTADIDAVSGGEVNQPGFLGSRNDPDPDPRLSAYFGNEVSAVFGFAGRTGGRRDNFVNLIGFGQPLELGQRLHRSRHG